MRRRELIASKTSDGPYLAFTALESGTFTLTIPANVGTSYIESISYSTDEGVTWTTTNNTSSAVTITTPTISEGDTVLWKGNSKSISIADYESVFSSTGNFNVSGNIMSLLYGDNFSDKTSFPSETVRPFAGLFKNCTKLKSIENLILPATALASFCYFSLFQGCTSLTEIPSNLLLPVTTLASGCYRSMFQGCTSLVTVPTDMLQATIMSEHCYEYMFKGCSKLTNVPNLPATSLNSFCYSSMFQDCTSLTTVPTGLLPATTLKEYCYRSMFDGCSKLTQTPYLPAVTLANGCYAQMFAKCYKLKKIYCKAVFNKSTETTKYTHEWVYNVYETGNFYKNSSSDWATGVNGIPSNWTVNTYPS